MYQINTNLIKININFCFLTKIYVELAKFFSGRGMCKILEGGAQASRGLIHSSRMQHPHCISYRMSHPCVVRCLQTIAVLTVCMDKLVCHMIKQGSLIGNLRESRSLSINLIANGDFEHDMSPVFSCNFSCFAGHTRCRYNIQQLYAE